LFSFFSCHCDALGDSCAIFGKFGVHYDSTVCSLYTEQTRGSKEMPEVSINAAASIRLPGCLIVAGDGSLASCLPPANAGVGRSSKRAMHVGQCHCRAADMLRVYCPKSVALFRYIACPAINYRGQFTSPKGHSVRV